MNAVLSRSDLENAYQSALKELNYLKTRCDLLEKEVLRFKLDGAARPQCKAMPPSLPKALQSAKVAPPPLPSHSLKIPPILNNTLSFPIPLNSGFIHGNEINDYVNVFWKPGSGSSVLPDSDDPFLSPFCFATSASSVHFDDCFQLLAKNMELLDDMTTTCSRDVPADEPNYSIEKVCKYFRKRRAKIDLCSKNPTKESLGKKSSLDSERQKLIGLAIGGALGLKSQQYKHKQFHTIKNFHDALMTCDYSTLTTSVLCPLLQLLKSITKEEFASVQTSMSQWECSQDYDALERWEDCDLFIFFMGKIPNVCMRVEFFIFEQNFSEIINSAISSLEELCKALLVIKKRLPNILNFIRSSLKLGNALNLGSRAPVLSRNFHVSFLLKCCEIKSTEESKFDFMHFVLTTIPTCNHPVFSDEEIVLLRRSATLRTCRVRDEAIELIDSYRVIEKFSQSLASFVSSGCPLSKKMSFFLEENHQRINQFAFMSARIFSIYKYFACLFEDSASLYPPPREQSSDNLSFDLLELIASFASAIRHHVKDLPKLNSKLSCPPDIKADVLHKRVPSIPHVDMKNLQGKREPRLVLKPYVPILSKISCRNKENNRLLTGDESDDSEGRPCLTSMKRTSTSGSSSSCSSSPCITSSRQVYPSRSSLSNTVSKISHKLVKDFDESAQEMLRRHRKTSITPASTNKISLSQAISVAYRTRQSSILSRLFKESLSLSTKEQL